MHISELAKLSGLSVDTLRFYEKQDLLNENHFVRRTNNYRAYMPAALTRLDLIKCAKLFGFTLSEIKVLLDDLSAHKFPLGQQADVLAGKLTEIDERIIEMQRLKTFISDKIDSLRQGTPAACQPPFAPIRALES